MIPRRLRAQASTSGKGYHLAMDYALGILVHGDNHFIVRGPLPDRAAALALTRHWSLIGIGATTPPELRGWQISSKEFRENLQWAVVVPGEKATSPAVTQLLDELRVRGVVINVIDSLIPFPPAEGIK